MTMARCIAPLLFALVAAQDTSSTTCTQAGHALMQTQRQLTSAEPAKSPAKNATVDNVADDTNAGARDSKQTTNTAVEAKAGDASAPKMPHASLVPASGRRSKDETNEAYIFKFPSDKKETNKADEADASRASAVFKKHSYHSGPSLLTSSTRWSRGDFCRSHPCSLLAVDDKRRGVGRTATLDEAGYQSVAALKDDEEMKEFILRVIEEYDCKVEHDGGFMGIVPWFSGTTAAQSFEKLTESLLFGVLANGERWISFKNTAGITGSDVPLDDQGYVEVAILRSEVEMETFARRLAEQMGIQITDGGGFAGMIKYYDGAATFQSFDKLREEIRSAAGYPNTWAQSK